MKFLCTDYHLIWTQVLQQISILEGKFPIFRFLWEFDFSYEFYTLLLEIENLYLHFLQFQITTRSACKFILTFNSNCFESKKNNCVFFVVVVVVVVFFIVFFNKIINKLIFNLLIYIILHHFTIFNAMAAVSFYSCFLGWNDT